MEIFQKARLLTDSGKYDSCGPKTCEIKINPGLGGIYNAKAENANCKLFKTLMTNSCNFDCKYCANPKCKQKTSYEPEELARLFNHLHKNLDINGLFLSSGIAGDANKITEKMLSAVKLIRYKYKFHGYVHFKVLPGTSYELIKQASEISDRMSINIEAPNQEVLSVLSTCKDYKTDILRRQAWISKLAKSQTTQIIVSNLATDRQILKMLKWEYEKLKLKRIYFSAFRPVKGTPMENEKQISPRRENHLYNVDFLIRKYNYSFNEIQNVFQDEMLPSNDPKLAIAKSNFSGPIDINSATHEELLRIPGIGPKTAQRIINAKENTQLKITNYNQLRELGACVERAKPFIKVNGKSQKMLGEFL